LTQFNLSDIFPGVGGRQLRQRAERHAALGDPVRLTIVDELTGSDRSPLELRRRLGIESNLLAHHLDALEAVGLISRSRSSGDGRRRYVHLIAFALADLLPRHPVAPQRALFVCSRNSARSQLAAALWRNMTDAPAESAGTHPADRIHPGAIAAARRAGFDLAAVAPRSIDAISAMPVFVVTVCDQAHEELDPPQSWLHWSVSDPVVAGGAKAFDATVAELRDRIRTVAGLAVAG
jgi:protein-tyrosine-phosphatase/DNA-binding transcriptional ArsR family regulator